jgi:hypothetical protein
MSSDADYNAELFQNSEIMLNLAQDIDRIFEEKLKNLEDEGGDGLNKEVSSKFLSLSF